MAILQWFRAPNSDAYHNLSPLSLNRLLTSQHAEVVIDGVINNAKDNV